MQPMHRQVLLLTAAQALFQTVSALVVTIGSLAGAALTTAPEWATAPIASMFLGMALCTIPASIWMTRVGRRTGFITGAIAGALGGIVGAWGIFAGSMLLLCLGTLLIGVYQAFAQYYRFAASEVADEAFRPRAISLVLAGGLVAAIAGPGLARLGSEWLQPTYSGSFLIIVIVSLLAAVLLVWLNAPAGDPSTSAEAGSARTIGEIVRQPAYLVALFGAVTGYGVMVLAMTATPLAMVHHHHGLGDATLVIQLHIVGMFLPSFFTGTLISRFGVLQVMGAGAVLLFGHVLLTLSGVGFYSFASALILLGVGWNFLYVGGTNLLTRTYTSAERGKAQATNDMTIVVVGLAASLSAGALHQTIGWQAMNLLLAPWLALAAASIIWLGMSRHRAVAA